MKPSETLCFDTKTRKKLWDHVVDTIETYITQLHQARVTPLSDPEAIRSLLSSMKFDRPMNPIEVLDFVQQGLWNHQVHVAHPRYFGLFNPAPTAMGIAADALVAAFNPQLATWNHSPFACEVEHHLIKTMAGQFGYDPEKADGSFTTGGAEANMTALLTALVSTFPEYAKKGLRALKKQPTLYVSTESHHSFLRAARFCGLGSDAVREIPVDERFRMKVQALETRIEQDRKAGAAPFLVVANAGTTNGGAIDPIVPIADVSSSQKLWFHVDAAWGGAAVFVPELRPVLEGIERSDSITFDSHKWLSVPMGAGLYLTKHPDILEQTFRITADYIPAEVVGQNIVDPYKHSMQCSRRFIGLKIFLSLAVTGLDGYASVIRHQTAMGDLMREKLKASRWEIVNQTKLPLVCFVDGQSPRGKGAEFVEAIARQIVSSGKAWISVTRLDKTLPVLRACITNYRTESQDINALVNDLNKAREKFYLMRKEK